MKKYIINAKKILCILLTVIMCVMSSGVAFSVSAEENKEIDVANISADSRQLFSKLFFENNDDVEKVIDYFDSHSDIDKITCIDEIIENLNLNTNYEETYCIIENLYFIDDYVIMKELRKQRREEICLIMLVVCFLNKKAKILLFHLYGIKKLFIKIKQQLLQKPTFQILWQQK